MQKVQGGCNVAVAIEREAGPIVRQDVEFEDEPHAPVLPRTKIARILWVSPG